MRKIEQQLVAAIRAWKDFRLKNTSFLRVREDMGYVYLHGNLIAIVYHYGRGVVPWNENTQRWDTRTTRSRMRALGCTLDKRTPGVWSFGTVGVDLLDPVQLELPFLV